MNSLWHIRSKWITLLVVLSILFVTVIPQQNRAAGLSDDTIRLGFMFNVSDPLGEIDAADGALNYVSPDWFGLDWNGRLVVYPDADLEMVSKYHLRGIKVVPFLSNGFNYKLGAIALNNREQLAEDIVAAVEKYNLDGVNYDIENVGPDEKDMQTDFVRLLNEKMPDKHISVSLVANPHNWSGGWHGSYDYVNLAKYSDHIVLMSYELMYYSRYNGNTDSLYGAPVAGEDAVIEQVEDLLERGIPSNKILLGIPFYARIWCEGTLDKETPYTDLQKRMTSNMGIALGHLQVNRITSHEGVEELKHIVDSRTKSDVTTFRVDEPILFPFIRLDPGYYSIYHESVESYTYKMAVMQRYQLAGYAAWAVGQEDPVFWKALGGGDATGGTYFIERNFADIRGHWAEDEILYGAVRSWLSWTKATRFYPNQAVTRAEAAATLRRTLNLSLASKVEIRDFIDVPETHWAHTDIQTLVYYNLMTGMTSEAPYRFGVYDELTRAQIATILDRIFLDDGTGIYDPSMLDRFDDKNEWTNEQWAIPSLARVVEAGLLYGFEEIVDGVKYTTLQPGATLTRAQLMAVLSRVDKLLIR
jgi:spore germination protein YaaH